MYQLIVRADATAMAGEAYNWYEQQQQDLGEEFLKHLGISFDKIIKGPLLYSKTHNNFRQATVTRFPFVIIYKIHKNNVIVHAIYHTSRKPKKKYRKL